MPENHQFNENLGLNQRIHRRDFINSTLLALGSALLSSMTPLELLGKQEWTGSGGVEDYARSMGTRTK